MHVAGGKVFIVQSMFGQWCSGIFSLGGGERLPSLPPTTPLPSPSHTLSHSPFPSFLSLPGNQGPGVLPCKNCEILGVL